MNRLPAATITDFQKGDAVLVVSTQGTDTGGVTAITLLGGVEPMLAAAAGRWRGGQAALLSPWNLGGGAPGVGISRIGDCRDFRYGSIRKAKSLFSLGTDCWSSFYKTFHPSEKRRGGAPGKPFILVEIEDGPGETFHHFERLTGGETDLVLKITVALDFGADKSAFIFGRGNEFQVLGVFQDGNCVVAGFGRGVGCVGADRSGRDSWAVTDPSGAVVAGASVIVTGADGSVASATTSQQGGFDVKGAGSGTI